MKPFQKIDEVIDKYTGGGKKKEGKTKQDQGLLASVFDLAGDITNRIKYAGKVIIGSEPVPKKETKTKQEFYVPEEQPASSSLDILSAYYQGSAQEIVPPEKKIVGELGNEVEQEKEIIGNIG
jgi:hypothetical protein